MPQILNGLLQIGKLATRQAGKSVISCLIGLA